MKKTTILWPLWALAFILIGIISCSDDDKEEKGNPQQHLLSGTWEEVKRESYKNEEIIPDFWTKGNSWTFKRDGSVILHSSYRVHEGTYEFKGNQIKVYYDWYGMDEVENREILKLDAESLVWKTIYPDSEYDYQILYLSRSHSVYDDPIEE